jgi:hypothetical protein
LPKLLLATLLTISKGNAGSRFCVQTLQAVLQQLLAEVRDDTIAYVILKRTIYSVYARLLAKTAPLQVRIDCVLDSNLSPLIHSGARDMMLSLAIHDVTGGYNSRSIMVQIAFYNLMKSPE